MRILSAITLLFSAAAFCSATSNLVTIKNNRDFDQTLQKNDMVLVKFDGSKCKNCKKIEPKVQKVADTLKKDKVLVAQVDCQSNKSVCDKYKIRAYPTLQVFKKGRPSNLMVKGKRLMIRDQVPSFIELHTKEELENLKNNEKVVVVAYTTQQKDDAFTAAWTQLANKLGNDYAFGLVTDKAFMEAENIETTPSVVLYKKFDNLRDVYNLPSVDKLEDFIRVNSLPLLAPYDSSTFIDYVDANRPLVYLFSENQEQQDQMHSLFLPLAEKYKGEFTFVHINPTTYAEKVDFLNLDNTWPAVAVHDFERDVRIPYDQSKPIDKEGVTEFLETIKTPPAVTEITDSNFEDIVLDKSKDVLLEVYAPWCGHCRHLEPIYQQLGDFMQAHDAAEQHGIVVAKMDGTKNKVPEAAGFTVRAYPTIKLIKAGTNEVVDFKGQRTLHDFVKFLQEESTQQTLKVDLSEKEEQINLKHNHANKVQIEDNKAVEA